MAVISVLILESSEQIIDGIPRSISISTNIPSSIFYTLDGSDPTIMSDQYLEPIITNSNISELILKVYATNGSDSSPIITEHYITNNLNQRKPHASVSGIISNSGNYPFGNNYVSQAAFYGNGAGLTQSSADNTNYSNSFDADANPTDFSDKPLTQEYYTLKYDENLYKVNNLSNIGTLPANVVIKQDEPIKNFSEMYSNLFDPKAMVIFQDFDNQKLDDTVSLNRQFFSLDNKDTSMYGAKFYSTANDGNKFHTGSFIRSEYNPRTNKITYYYRDSVSNKWIISSQTFVNTGNWQNNLSGISLNSRPGSRFVYEWIPGMYRTLI